MLKTLEPYDPLSEFYQSTMTGGWGGNCCLASFVYRKKLLDRLLEKFPVWG